MATGQFIRLISFGISGFLSRARLSHEAGLRSSQIGNAHEVALWEVILNKISVYQNALLDRDLR